MKSCLVNGWKTGKLMTRPPPESLQGMITESSSIVLNSLEAMGFAFAATQKQTSVLVRGLSAPLSVEITAILLTRVCF